MAGAGLLALLEDIATLLDDVAVLTDSGPVCVLAQFLFAVVSGSITNAWRGSMWWAISGLHSSGSAFKGTVCETLAI